MKIVKQVKRWGGSYCIPIEKKYIENELLDTDTYYVITVEKCQL